MQLSDELDDNSMDRVFVLQHTADYADGSEDVKFISVYSSRPAAEAAIRRLTQQPGFAEHGEGFDIDEYDLDKDHWVEGFGIA